MQKALSSLGNAWCKLMHPDPMWPVNGRYICPTCQRSYAVPWEAPEAPVAAAAEANNENKVLPIRAPGRAAA